MADGRRKRTLENEQARRPGTEASRDDAGSSPMGLGTGEHFTGQGFEGGTSEGYGFEGLGDAERPETNRKQDTGNGSGD